MDSIVGKSSPAKVEGVILRNRTNGALDQIDIDGVFVAIGHAPASSLLAGKVDLHADGNVKVQPGTTTTSVAGLFAAGDVTDSVYRQAVTAAGLGCMAALEADRFLTIHADSKFGSLKDAVAA